MGGHGGDPSIPRGRRLSYREQHRGVQEGGPRLVEPGRTEQSLDENQQHPRIVK